MILLGITIEFMLNAKNAPYSIICKVFGKIISLILSFPSKLKAYLLILINLEGNLIISMFELIILLDITLL
jgi:hypothetical protein